MDSKKQMINSPSAIHTNSPTTTVDDEINFREILATLVRQKNLIAFFTFIAVLFSAGFAATRKPVWEGRFEIVLENRQSGASTSAGLSQLLQTNPLVANLASMGGVSTNQLGTQVKVLESPLVLKPTYEFVKTNKTQKGENVKNWSFLEWRNKSLKVELQKGTSVLNITYRDTDPDLVLPVIQRISSDYQRYSGRHRSESIRNGLAFAKKQVDQFRKQAADSSRALDAFSIRYGISSNGESIPSTINNAMQLLGSNIDSDLLAAASRQGRFKIAGNRVNRFGLSRQGDALANLQLLTKNLSVDNNNSSEILVFVR